MGIRGLPHYIANCCVGVFQDNVQLRNTRLIIDGNNFFRTFPLQLRGDEDAMIGYGCNYDMVYTALNTFFKKLRLCNIEPVVIFVGTTSCQNFIFERVKRRNQEQINRLQEFVENNYSIRPHSLPRGLPTKTLLVRFLNDHCIHHLTMDFEEDDQIVALANRWNCPIMTADSDFYLYQYNKNARVIPIWRFDITVHKDRRNGRYYIETKTYNTSDFAKFHSFNDHRFVSLFAAIQLEQDESQNFMDILPLQLDERDKELHGVLSVLTKASKDMLTFDDVIDNLPDYFQEVDDELIDIIKTRANDFLMKDAKEEY